jgi:hypothetical protein
MTYHFNSEVYVEGITVEVEARAEGFYCEGDSFGYGCEPPDGDFKITEVNIIRAYPDCPEEPIEVTEELRKKVWEKLYSEEFEED